LDPDFRSRFPTISISIIHYPSAYIHHPEIYETFSATFLLILLPEDEKYENIR